MKLHLIIPAAILGLILSAVFYSGCSSSRERNADSLADRIKNPDLPVEQRTQLLAELGIKALQESKDTILLLNYAKLLSSAGYVSPVLKIYRDETVKHPEDKELQAKVLNAELACMIIPCDTHAVSLSESQVEYIRELDSIRSLDERIVNYPSDPSLYVLRGNHFLVIDQESAGIWDIKKSLTLDSCFPDALFSLAVMEMREKKNLQSLTTMIQLENCIQEKDIIPRQPWLDFKAFLHSIIKTDSLIRQNPVIPDYYVQKARIYIQGKEYDLAISVLSEGLKSSPDNGEIYAFRAFVNYSAGNQQEALHDLAKAELLTGKTDTELSNLIRGNR